MVDTCAAEFAAKTPYYYSTYEQECELTPSANKKVLIIGAGPIRIGQGIEFDYCTVHAVAGAARGGHRGPHHQQQPRDRIHGLRHLGQALLRAYHARARDEHHRKRAPVRRDGPVRRPDFREFGDTLTDGAAQAQGPGYHHHRHQPRRHEHRGGPRPLGQDDEGDGHTPAGARHSVLDGGREGRGQRGSATRYW